MQRLRFSFHASLERVSSYVLKYFPLAKKTLEEGFRYFRKTNAFTLYKDVTLCSCLFFFLGIGLFLKDFVSDKLEVRDVRRTIEEKLRCFAQDSDKLFEDLRRKILLEKMDKKKKAFQHLFLTLNQLLSYSPFPSSLKITGARWVTPDLRAIGPYGTVTNFEYKLFMPFLRSLEQKKNKAYLSKRGDQIYVGMGITKGSVIKGYLLVPVSLEELTRLPSPSRTLGGSLRINLPFQGVSLDEMREDPASLLQTDVSVKWRSYIMENLVTYVIFFLVSLSLFFLKQKNDERQEAELSEAHTRTSSLSEGLSAQQAVINLILTRLHDATGSIMEISNLLLEAKTSSSSTVFSEKEQTNFMKRIYQVSQALENKVMLKKVNEHFEVSSLTDQCLGFFSALATQSSIVVRKDYGAKEVGLESDKESFLQLILALLYKAFERLPEKGGLSIHVQEALPEEEAVLIITFEDTGYPFSAEELKSFKKTKKPPFETCTPCVVCPHRIASSPQKACLL